MKTINNLEGSILGIDFGQSKVGLAIANYEIEIAFAHSILKNDKNLIAKIRTIVLEEEVNKIIIGKSSYHNSENQKDQEEFALKLSKELEVSVELFEEMFTTKIAQKNLREAGRNSKSPDDSEAARIILQMWLDKSADSAS